MILSTGIAEIKDIELAVETCRDAGNHDITILKCTSAYPADPKEANLITIPDIKSRFGVKVGLSDHTMGIEGPIAAAVLGAEMIEKHFILDKSIGGPDAHFSLDEKEFTEMVNAVRKVEEMLGEVDYKMTESKRKSKRFSRSLYLVEDVKSGDIITESNMRSIRPGNGIHPKYYNELLGKQILKDTKRGTPLSFNLLK